MKMVERHEIEGHEPMAVVAKALSIRVVRLILLHNILQRLPAALPLRPSAHGLQFHDALPFS